MILGNGVKPPSLSFLILMGLTILVLLTGFWEDKLDHDIEKNVCIFFELYRGPLFTLHVKSLICILFSSFGKVSG